MACLGLGWSSSFNSVDQNSSNWHQDPSAHWINPPLSSIWPFFCFLYQLHPFLYSFSWLLKGERWHVPGHVCGIFFIIIFLNPAISSVTFADCRVTGSYIFPLPPLSLSLWNRSFVCEQLKQNGRRIHSSAGNASRAEMLLGKETGKRQKTSPLTASVHMTLGPEWARKEAGGGTAQQALVHTQRN